MFSCSRLSIYVPCETNAHGLLSDACVHHSSGVLLWLCQHYLASATPNDGNACVTPGATKEFYIIAPWLKKSYAKV